MEETSNPGLVSPAMSLPTEMGSLHAEWRGQDWVAPLPGEAVTVLAMRREPQQAVLVADPRLHLAWLDLADRSLSGPAHESVWGTSTSAISWRTRELVALGAALLLVLAWRVRRRWIRTSAGSGRNGGA